MIVAKLPWNTELGFVGIFCHDWRRYRVSYPALAFLLIAVQLACGGTQAASAPAPMVIDSVSPLPTLNGPAFTMRVNGSGFLRGVAVMEPGGIFFSTTFIDSGHLDAAIPANAFTNSTTTIYVYLANPPNCTNQYCDLGYWSNAFQVQAQPAP